MVLDQGVFDAFIESLVVENGASENTVSAYRRDYSHFAQFCQNNGISNVDPHVLRQYLAYMHAENLSARTQARRMSALKQYFRYLIARDVLKKDPMQDIAMPKLPRSLPKALTKEEVKSLLAAQECDAPESIRARAILETLYATGLRVSELIKLKTTDLQDGERRTLRITGKGSKTRMVPLGKMATDVLEMYIRKSRPIFDKKKTDWLFPSRSGRPLTRQRLFQIVREAGQKVGMDLSPHHLRHTFATHLLENDADLRSVQLMLGHADVATTQIYTHVLESRARKVLETSHPLGKDAKLGNK
ncbi:MAG: site-specific tyrosine recombinase XerD [Proteobacteria bacterium]|nr:site-specific tyrosine recombinase XerD [Pseudomonadota bacterium]